MPAVKVSEVVYDRLKEMKAEGGHKSIDSAIRELFHEKEAAEILRTKNESG